MKILDRILTTILTASLLIVGFILGTKYAKPETTINFKSIKAKKDGTINVTPDVKIENTESTVKDKKRFKLFKRKK